MKPSVDQAQLNELKTMVEGLHLNGPKILTRALNRTLNKSKTAAAKRIKEKVGFKSKKTKEKFKDKKATWKSLSARLYADKRGLLLTNFVVGTTPDGHFQVKVLKGNKTKIIKNAFLTKIKAGDQWVDVIAERAEGRYATGNRKINILYGPSTSQVFEWVKGDVEIEMAGFLLQVTEKEIATDLRGY